MPTERLRSTARIRRDIRTACFCSSELLCSRLSVLFPVLKRSVIFLQL